MSAPATLSFEQVKATNRPVAGPTGVLPEAVDVAIVGAGPVGLEAANLLGARGIRTLVIEQNEFTSDQPKAVIVDDEHMRMLDRMGLTEQARPHITGVPYGLHFISPFGFELIKASGFRTPNGFSNRNSASQPMLEKILLEATQRFPDVTVRYQCRLIDLAKHAEHVDLVVRNHNGVETTVRAVFVIACDGANSFVRERLGIPFVGERIDEPHLVIDFAEFPDQSPFSRFHCHPDRPFNSVLVPYGGRRIEFMLMPGDDRKQITSLDSIRKLVDRHTPYRGVDLKVVRSAVYGFSARIAQRMRDGRVFLAGDAAHVMPPFGAQGLNSGARDAGNLTWKLATVLRGEAELSSLDSYDAERRANIESIVAYSVRVGRIANIRFWPAAVLRDLLFAIVNLFPRARRYFSEMRYMPKPVMSTGLLLPDTRKAGSLVGRMFPRLMVPDANGQGVSFDARVGSGFALVGIDVDAVTLQDAARHPLWARLRPALLDVRLADLDTGLRSMLAPHAGDILIVRPDRYVAAAAEAAKADAMSDTFGRLLG